MSVLQPHQMGQQIRNPPPVPSQDSYRTSPTRTTTAVTTNPPETLNPYHASVPATQSYIRAPRPSELFASSPFGIRPSASHTNPGTRARQSVVIPHGLGSLSVSQARTSQPTTSSPHPVEPVHAAVASPHTPMETAEPPAGVYPRSSSSTVTNQPPWWRQIWSFARSGSPQSFPVVNSEAHARAQGELQRDLTALVLSVLARCSGLEISELQRSPTLQEWVGQHLQPLTHHTPEWMQFVALVGVKKLSKNLSPTDTHTHSSVPCVLDPLLAMETLPSVVPEHVTIATDVITTTPDDDVEVMQGDDAHTKLDAANQTSTDMVVDIKTEPITPEETLSHHHVTFASQPRDPKKTEDREEEETIDTLDTQKNDTSVHPDHPKKRKRTATPGPSRVAVVPRAVEQDNKEEEEATKKKKTTPTQKKPKKELESSPPTPKPRVPRAPRSAATKNTRAATKASIPVSDPLLNEEPLLALPEIAVL